ncbi:MAG TPA: hypothetical protein VK717_11320 [Opitutaceae bacterium]|nr:hypothetical protein [Opitutaceae bacterium]
MPPGNAEAMVHYEDTIRKKVEVNLIASLVDSDTQRKLKTIFGDRPIATWGSRDTSANRAKFDRMKDGDEVLIVEGDTVKLLGRVAAKTVNPKLSRQLWKNLRGEVTEGWDLIYFIANPREVGVPFASVRELVGYEPNFQLRGFMAVSADKLAKFYAVYDDLYSILLAKKAGQKVQKLPNGAASYPEQSVEKANRAEENAPESTPGEEPKESAHVWMQWTLLRMGRQAGQKVWAPRSDQSRITTAHNFTDFEPTFASGLDTQVKYVENIDVVWKEEFRIDAAFEVENSTSIYSGLLRFADLTMVAPNTHYPLFIVAPEERKNRVREQLVRPTFKHLRIAEKVRFLSYEKVREIDQFFGSRGKGMSVEVFTGRAENLS